jgi:hypothetical protein
MEELLLLGGVVLAVVVIAPILGATMGKERAQSLSESGREVIKGGIKFGMEVAKSWNDLVTEAQTEMKEQPKSVQPSQTSAQPPQTVELN